MSKPRDQAMRIRNVYRDEIPPGATGNMGRTRGDSMNGEEEGGEGERKEGAATPGLGHGGREASGKDKPSHFRPARNDGHTYGLVGLQPSPLRQGARPESQNSQDWTATATAERLSQTHSNPLRRTRRNVQPLPTAISHAGPGGGGYGVMRRLGTAHKLVDREIYARDRDFDPDATTTSHFVVDAAQRAGNSELASSLMATQTKIALAADKRKLLGDTLGTTTSGLGDTDGSGTGTGVGSPAGGRKAASMGSLPISSTGHTTTGWGTR